MNGELVVDALWLKEATTTIRSTASTAESAAPTALPRRVPAAAAKARSPLNHADIGKRGSHLTLYGFVMSDDDSIGPHGKRYGLPIGQRAGPGLVRHERGN